MPAGDVGNRSTSRQRDSRPGPARGSEGAEARFELDFSECFALSWPGNTGLEEMLEAANGHAPETAEAAVAADRPAPANRPAERPEEPAADAASGEPLSQLAGRVAEDLLPGPGLAGWLSRADASQLGDYELAGVAAAGRRLASWASAAELAAVAEMTARATARDSSVPIKADGRPAEVSDEAAAEVSLALTMSQFGATLWANLAVTLRWRLPGSFAALSEGRIDLARTRLIAEVTSVLSDRDAQVVEAKVLDKAGHQTTGQLRAALRRAVISVDPKAAERRREEAERRARVDLYADEEGTATLTGRNLPGTQACAAMARITALAQAMKAAGANGGMDLLRAQVLIGLLLNTLPGIPPPLEDPAAPGPADPASRSPDDPPSQEPDDPPGEGPDDPPNQGPDDPPGQGPGEPPSQGPTDPRDDPGDGGRPPRGDSWPGKSGPEEAGPEEAETSTQSADKSPDGQECRPGDATGPPATRPRAQAATAQGGRVTGPGPGSARDESGSVSAEEHFWLRDPPDGVDDDVGDDTWDHYPRPDHRRPPTPPRPVPAWPPLPMRGEAEIPASGCPPSSTGRRGKAAGRLRMEVPWRTLAGLSPEPGNICWLGPITPAAARKIAEMGAGDPLTEWRVIVTDRSGQALLVTRVPKRKQTGQRQHTATGPGTDQAGGSGLVSRITLTLSLEMASGPPQPASWAGAPSRSSPLGEVLAAALAAARNAVARAEKQAMGRPGTAEGRPGTAEGRPGVNGAAGPAAGTSAGTPAAGCGHDEAEARYRPSGRLREFLIARDQTCRFPPCRQPAWQADLDHTNPFDKGGPTCRCNLGPMCRRNHKIKQRPGWRLDQPQPGHFVWTTPAGRKYLATPDLHPV